MNIICKSSALAVCAGLFACGGSQKPAVEPAAADSSAVQAPARLDTLITDQDRFSYALGMDLGRAIANVNIPLRMDLVKKAIDDQMDSTKKPLLSDSASETALQDLLLRMQQQKESEEKATAKKALEDQLKFLAKNILDSTVKTTPKGVQYKVILGGKGISPKASDKVQVHYIGALPGPAPGDEGRHEGQGLDPERPCLRRGRRAADDSAKFASRVRSRTFEGLCRKSGSGSGRRNSGGSGSCCG